MQVQAYPELSDVEQTLRKLQAIFDLYREQRDKKDAWSSTLWSELDLGVLERGMESYEARLKSLTKLFGIYEAELKSLTKLFEALRERHWKQLMDLTGTSFDMNPKGGTERGFVLRTTDEIQLTLEDQMMNLSSMSASRFVGPFLDQTQKWEKLMSTIAEVIAVWMKVQSKWMYLEAIFVGSEDIRLQAWLLTCEAEMMRTLNKLHKEGTFYYAESDRVEWIGKQLGMIVNTAAQVWWAWECEDTFNRVRAGNKGAMKAYAKKCSDQLERLIKEVQTLSEKIMTKKVNTLIIIDLHNRDIVDTFVRDSILDAREFAWESQLRFYWDRDEDDVSISQCSGSFLYGYEYQGLSGRLVITPLTDRCYMTMTQALSYRLGTAPAGPAGTGKTETVKDLAKAMALQCVVFNCGEGLDYKVMGSIFSGLVQCGAWGCFDEFNRIDVEVLSVVSTQIKTIQNACLEQLKRFTFESREIALNPSVGIFITMNPGYAGRTELPDNLKALFRPVTMVVPNLELICMVMLMSEGFITAKVLAKKMTTLYKLAKEQLSKQYHYDFGLRALKSVLVMAGDLKRSSPELSEATILMRALRDMNMPKFVFEDVPLFKGLIKDLFPGLDTPRVRYASFNDAVDAALVDSGYQFLEVQADKVVQLYETMLTRHTTMIVGPTGGGKTVLLNTLKRAQDSLGVPTKMHTLNPKAQSVLELYGVLDPATRDWTDGLLSNIFREMNKPVPEGKDERRYIVYDGDVDALWVENMNSVMDDNKLLTLPNGERIRLNYPTCCMLYEVFDLQYASPATVSRCGMVYVDPKDLGYKPFLDSWLAGRERESPAEAGVLTGLMGKYLTPCVEYVVDGIEDKEKMLIGDPLKQIVPRTDLGLTMQLTRLLDGMLTAERAIIEPPMLEAIFVLCLTWSVGGALVQEARLKFDKFLKKLSGLNVNPSETASNGPGQLPGFLPTLHDYLFDPDERRWVAWSALVPAYAPPADGKFSSIVVPTSDTVRTSWLLESVVNGSRSPILLVGESGTAKTTITRAFIQSQSAEKTISLTINFSSRTSARDVQAAIEDTVEKRTKDTYGPPAGKRLLIFVDDLNMPRVDTYGTQQPIALLKLLLDKGFMYDRKDLSLKYIKDIQSISAMAPPGGARAMVDPRFVNLFSVFSITFPPEASIQTIYATILEQHFNGGIFDPRIEQAGLAQKLTAANLELFNAIIIALPATPSKFHYVFNLRDLSRVTEGLLQSTPDRFTESGMVVRLWRHEVLRCFYDRLVGKSDKEFVSSKIAEILRKDFGEHADRALEMPILFGDFLKFNEIEEAEEAKESTDHVRLVEDMPSYDAIKVVLDSALERYNASNKAMNLVLFDDCLDHLVRVHRILRLPRGNALLVGVGGSGKQSITRLAAHVANCDVFEITLTRGYSEVNFREDLKTLYGMLPNKAVAFLFTDSHVAEEGFLELINNLLAAGIVPALYEEAERDGIINNVRDEVVKKGLPDSKDAVWQYFVDKCRDNLHIVLAMSPIGEALRVRCRSFPGMINNTVIDWFVPWPHQALLSVAGVFLAEEKLPDASRGDIVEHMVLVQESVMKISDDYELQLKRHNYVTPKNYLDFISNYKKSLKEERKKVDTQVARLDGGLQKLIQAAKEVDIMSEKLKIAKAEVDVKSKEVKEMLEVISENTTKAEAKKAEATQREGELEVSSVQIEVEKREAEQALEMAIPALEEAAAALKSLNKDDITEIRSFANPHDLVRKVCECVYVLKGLGLKDLSWKASKAMMSDMQFLQSLVEYDKDSIQDKQIKKVKEAFQDPSFTVESVQNISRAGGGLLKWVYAIVNYHGVAKTVNPKRQAVANAEKSLRQAQKDLAKIKKDVIELEELLRDLGDKYETGTAEEQELTAKAETMERQLIAASKLISGLGSERERWTKDISALQQKRVMLIGDCLLAAAFLSYTGAFNFDFRRTLMVDTWEKDLREKQVPVTNNYRIETLLTSEVETAKWASEGLPPDELSIQNGILTTRASRYPLCIDPQQQAVTWIKKREAKSNLKVCTFTDADFLKHLEIAVNLGFAFLFEGVDEYIDPIIDPVLEKNIVKRANSRTVKIGDKDVEWDDSFNLYLTSKLSNPHYGPETFGKAMIINYSVTLQGLEDQLLNVVVEHERKDLADQRSTLIQDMSDLSETLKELEDSLLYELANSTGNILDNTPLISTLEQTKTKATEISAKLELAKVTSTEIDEACSLYRSVATRGSILFFVMASLAALNNMYELSLALYMIVFGVALDKAQADPILDHRLDNMITTLTKDCYNYTCMGIFETHKLMFSFQMCISILEGHGQLNRAELDFFLKGNLSLEKSDAPPHAWIPEKTWHDVMRLVLLDERFKDLASLIRDEGEQWQAWFDLDSPEATELPSGLSATLDRLEQMCVLRCFRIDRVYIATTKFVEHALGSYYVSPPVLEYGAIFSQSTETTPIVFILSPGADPASDIFKLAAKMGMDKRLKFMALGQGQGPIAASMLDMGAQRGHWVMLQNCHLLPSWLKTLEKLLLQLAKPHADFRLWLTTEPTDRFPIGILQRSIKVVTEPPNGLRLNMMSSYSKVSEENLAHCAHPAYRSTVFVLAFLHAVVQERRKYGKVGWNVRYDFNDSDFRVSLMLIEAYLTKAHDNEEPAIPWDTLRYLTGEVMYGGRVTDDLDRRVLTTYLHEYFGDFLFDTFQPFHFFKNGEVDYSVPQRGHRDAYISAIQAMPSINSPEVFGLHPNAEINYLTHASKKLWADLLELQPRQAAAAGEMSREQYIDKVASDILSKMPQPFDVNRIKKEAEGELTPTFIVLAQELERWELLCARMSKSLKELRRAIAGEVGMSTELDHLGSNLYNGQLPDMWRKLTPQTQKMLGPWMVSFLRRHRQYKGWVEEGEPRVMWLSGLHIPETYTAALVQTTCRKYKWALDKSTLYTSLTKMLTEAEVLERPEDGCYVTGLYMEGAAFDVKRSCLLRQAPKVLVQELPIMQIIPIELSKLKLQGTIRVPMYTTQERKNAMGVGLMMEADVRTVDHLSHWILQGVAITLNIDT
ncbi:dynein heavy chain and region D6 of dynein motor-domain-containing protein [Pavlovales sp. CCMP2436]|nr:dynein heavy chain and region D6 of dynein motor-domain-containing protein [Pavlovales sp. CCMP2436]